MLIQQFFFVDLAYPTAFASSMNDVLLAQVVLTQPSISYVKERPEKNVLKFSRSGNRFLCVIFEDSQLEYFSQKQKHDFNVDLS